MWQWLAGFLCLIVGHAPDVYERRFSQHRNVITIHQLMVCGRCGKESEVK